MTHPDQHEVSTVRASADAEDVMHIVGDVQHLLDRLGLKVPRALCGVLLVADPSRQDLDVDASTCPRCTTLNQGRKGALHVH